MEGGTVEDRTQLRDWRDVDTGNIQRPALICRPAPTPVAVLDGVATEDRARVLEQALTINAAFLSIADVEVLLAQWHVLLEREYVKKKSFKGAPTSAVRAPKECTQAKRKKTVKSGESASRCRFRCKSSKKCEFGLNLTQKSPQEPWIISQAALHHSCENLSTPKSGRVCGPLRKDVAMHILQPHIDRDVNMTEEKCKEVLQNAMGGPFRHSSSLVSGARRGCIEELYARLGMPFGLLESLGQQLQTVDQDNELTVEYNEETKSYIRSFLAIGPMRRLFQGGGVRTLTSFVCIAIGDPVFQGYLLCLNVSDVANRVAPMFIAHVDEVTAENVLWFFQQCFRLEPRMNFEDFSCIIGCPDVYSQVLHVVECATKLKPLLCCAVLVQEVMHASDNKKQACDSFFSAARAAKPEHYSRIMEAWAAVDANACNCAQRVAPELWCNAFVHGCRVGMPGVVSSELGNTGFLQLLESIAKLPAIDVFVQLYSFAVDELVDRLRIYKTMFLAGNTRPPFTTKMLAETFDYVRTCSATLSAFHEDHLIISHTDGVTRVDRLPYIVCHRCADQHIFGVPCWHEVFACQSWAVSVDSTIHPELDITATLRALVQVDSVCRLPEDLASKLKHNGSHPPPFLVKGNRRTHFVAVHGRKFNFGRWGKKARKIPRISENIVEVTETTPLPVVQRRHSILVPQEERSVVRTQNTGQGSLDLRFEFQVSHPPLFGPEALSALSEDFSVPPSAVESAPETQGQITGTKRLRRSDTSSTSSSGRRTNTGTAFPSSSDIPVGPQGESDSGRFAVPAFLLGHSPILMPSTEPMPPDLLQQLDAHKATCDGENSEP